MPEFCPDHSGCTARINNLEHENESQWKEMREMRKKHDNLSESIGKRQNAILGAVAIACIMLAINILIKAI